MRAVVKYGWVSWPSSFPNVQLDWPSTVPMSCSCLAGRLLGRWKPFEWTGLVASQWRGMFQPFVLDGAAGGGDHRPVAGHHPTFQTILILNQCLKLGLNSFKSTT